MSSLKLRGVSLEDLGTGDPISHAKFSYQAWDDNQIRPGDAWQKEIQTAMERARVAILLVSVDFLCSKFIVSQELPALLQREAQGDLPIIPLIVRPNLWEAIDVLNKLQATPDNGKALSELSQHECERLLTQLMLKIDNYVDQLDASDEDEATEMTEEASPNEPDTSSPQPTPPCSSSRVVHFTSGPFTEAGKQLLTWTGVRDLIDNASGTTGDEYVVEHLLLFKTTKQRTWLAVTSQKIYCVLDDEKMQLAIFPTSSL